MLKHHVDESRFSSTEVYPTHFSFIKTQHAHIRSNEPSWTHCSVCILRTGSTGIIYMDILCRYTCIYIYRYMWRSFGVLKTSITSPGLWGVDTHIHTPKTPCPRGTPSLADRFGATRFVRVSQSAWPAYRGSAGSHQFASPSFGFTRPSYLRTVAAAALALGSISLARSCLKEWRTWLKTNRVYLNLVRFGAMLSVTPKWHSKGHLGYFG